MPLTHEYPRFLADSRFGVAASPRCNILCCDDGTQRRRPTCVTGAAEDAIVWNPATGEAVRKFREEDEDEDDLRPRAKAGACVTRLAWHAATSAIAVGYSDGWVRLYHLHSGELLLKFCGHKHAVAALAFHPDGGRLAAAGADSDVTVLRVECESGYRLKGHTNSVTQVEFVTNWPTDCLISASKDGLVKFWNLELRACFKTLTGHPGEVWDFLLLDSQTEEKLLVTGSCDNQLRVWRLTHAAAAGGDGDADDRQPEPKRAPVAEASGAVADLEESVVAEFAGAVAKAAAGRVHSLSRCGDRLLAAASNSRSVEFFAAPAERQLRARLRQRQKKAGKRGADRAAVRLVAADLLLPAGQLTGFPAKVRCLRACPPDSDGTLCFVSLADNSVAGYRLLVDEEQPLVTVAGQGPGVRHGHRGAVRSVDVSSDSLAVLTASAGQLKLWHYSSLSCVLTIECPTGAGQLTRCCFLPGDRFAAVGTSSGQLLLCDLADNSVAEQLQAHEAGQLGCLARLADGSGLLTASAEEKRALQWRFEIVKSDSGVGSRLGLLLSRSVALSDGAVAACQSGDGRLLCLSLLDSSVRVLFHDTAREFLHLHGHSQPATSLAVGHDCAVLASGSGDRTVRLWGLQFGDCQHVFRAHDFAVSHVTFLTKQQPHSLLLTASADGTLKLWDAKKFKRVATLFGHQAAVAGVAAAPNGEYFASVDKDASVRTWRRCEEPLVLEEEREMEKEAQYEEELGQQQEGPDNAASNLVARLSLESVKGAERLIEAIEVFESEQRRVSENSEQPEHPAAAGADTPQQFFAQQLGSLALHDMEQSVLALPTVYAQRLLAALHEVSAAGLQPEKVARCVGLCLSFHYPQLLGSQQMSRLFEQLQEEMASSGERLTEMLGFNLAGMRVTQRMLEAQEQVDLFAEAAAEQRGKKKGKKKKKKMAFQLQTH